jgi:DNA-binding beta-propeller fold protein YncE
MSSPRGTKRSHDEHYDTFSDNNDIKLEVTTGQGVTLKFALPPDATVLRVKEEVEREVGINPRDACIFANDAACEEELANTTMLRSLRRAKGAKVEMSLLVEQADAQQVVPAMASEADVIIGEGSMSGPSGVAFVPAHPDWLVVTDVGTSPCVTITNISTGALVCHFGEDTQDDDQPGQFDLPLGVAVTSDSSHVIVADHMNHRLQVLRLVVGADGSSAHLEFVRFIGSGYGSSEGCLDHPTRVTLLPSKAGQENVLVTDQMNNRVLQFALNGTFIRIFAGNEGTGAGEFKSPSGIAVMGVLEEVAVVDVYNHRVQIFDSDGNSKLQFGSEGKEDGQFEYINNITSDVHGNLLVTDTSNRLQLFSPKGDHLCTRDDLGLVGDDTPVAWSANGDIAIACCDAGVVRVWAATAKALAGGTETAAQ